MEQKEVKKLIDKFNRNFPGKWPRCIGCGEEIRDIPCDVAVWKRETMYLCPECKRVEFPNSKEVELNV